MGYDEISVIKQAIEHEYEGHDYYLQQSKKINSDEVSKVFRDLADEEILHVKWLEELLKCKNEGLPVKMLNFINEMAPPDIFDWKEVKNFRFDDLKETFKHIMNLELKAVEFYNEASNNATDEATKELFSQISKWELSHYQLFKNKYDEL